MKEFIINKHNIKYKVIEIYYLIIKNSKNIYGNTWN